MTTLVSELYTALKAAGVEDTIAQAAARSVLAIEDKEQLATKGDILALKADLFEVKAEVATRLVTAMSIQTAAFAAIVGLLIKLLK